MSSIPKLDLGGIYPPIPTPFDDKEEINFAALESNVKKWKQLPFRGFVVHGSNGEYTYQTPEEKVEVVRKLRSWVSKDKLIIAGAGCESTRDTIRMSQAMAGAGADAVLVVTPFYYKNSMTSDALCNHFTQVADNSPVPVLLYTVLAFTTIDMSVESVVTLAKHPNIIGIKESSGNVIKIGHIINKTKNEDFQVLGGSASYLLQSAVVGAVGGVCALANVLGEDVCRLYELIKDGNLDASAELQRRLIAPNLAVTSKFGVPGLKFALDKFGYYGGKPRSPLMPLGKEQQELLLNDFKEDGFLK